MVNRKSDKPAHRPQKHIDWEIVDSLLMAGCSGTQIAAYLGIHPETLYIRCEREKEVGFSAYAQTKREKGDTVLLAAQFDEAVKKRNTALMIWLGKSRLNQRETRDYDVKGNVNYQIVNYGDKTPLSYEQQQVIEVRTEKLKDNTHDTQQEGGVPADPQIEDSDGAVPAPPESLPVDGDSN
jgi:IS30 family transposase